MDITTAISDAVSLDLITHVVRSDIGMRREENQDSFTIIEGEGFKFFVVADGMGGVKGGAEASQLAAVVLAQCLKSKNSITDEDIVSAVNRVNTAIFERGIEKPEYAGMGTTLVGLCFLGSNFYVVNVGDSRAYRIREGGITQLTEDHTLVTELLRSGAIDESQVENHPVSHMLTRSLGPTPIVDVDCRLETSAA
ncbi:MAG: serine/threonine-protein phosphatase, partial [Deltaproteobacteria bacterium]|nr:serine/threonine-protein phosphatase [Deltaproteobacteria bacterium]